MRIERVALEHHGDIARAGRQVGHHRAVDDDIARGRPLEAGDHAHQRGLAAARGAEQDEELAFLGGEVDAVDRADLIEQLDDVTCFDRCHELVRLLSVLARLSAIGETARPGTTPGSRNLDPEMIGSDHLAIFPLGPDRLHGGVGAVSSAFSGVSAPVAAAANIVLITQVLNVSSIAALE